MSESGSTVVLDASAIVAYARREPGADVVASLLREAQGIVVSAVNWAEAAAKLLAFDVPPEFVRRTLAAFGAEVAPFSEADADDVALLAAATRHIGLSLGDRACLALTRKLGGMAITADRAWSKLDLPEVELRQIR